MQTSYYKIRDTSTTGELPIEFLEFQVSSMRSFRLVNQNSFFHCLVLSFFEFLSTNPDKNISDIATRRSRCCKKFESNNPASLLILKFLEIPKFEIIEILRNNFEGFLIFKKVLFCYFYHKRYKKMIDLSLDFDSFLLNNHSETFKIIEKIFGLEFRVLNSSGYEWRISPKKKVSTAVLTLFQMDPQSFCIVYSDKRAFSTIQSDLENSLNTLNLTSDKFCIICLYICEDSVSSCFHKIHLDCLRKLNSLYCPECSLPVKRPCFICKFSKPISFCCSTNTCFACQNCLVMSSYSVEKQEPYLRCDCGEHLNLSSFSLNCVHCKKFRFLDDFITVPCPDQHEFLCKACWASHLDSIRETTKSMNLKKKTCPFNKRKILMISEVIYKILKIFCQLCEKENCQYFGDFVCVQNCSVCTDCQGKTNKKLRFHDKCANCNQKMKPKESPWSLD